MAFKFLLTCIMMMYFNTVDNSEAGGRWIQATEPQNIETRSEIILTARNELMRQKESRNIVDSDMLTRMANMEISQNELMKSVKDILQITKDNQNQLITTQETLNKKIDNFNIKSDIFENKLNILETRIESFFNLSYVMHRRETTPSILEQNIRDVKRAASLLAVTKIKLADLPYTMHCGSNGEMGENESRMDACIQTRLEELYNDFNDVMDFHVMLVGGSGPHEGRVEIIYQRRHGTVCARHWDILDAKVVCKMLGYKEALYSYGGSRFGDSTGEILFDLVQCTGNEGSLLACKHRGIGGFMDVSSYCHHGNDAGVSCRT